jgi:uncharacterized protein (TIGR02996 family)
MSDDSAFLQAVLASPDDNDLRLIYADWLEERGDARGPFLRLEVAQHQSKRPVATPEIREQLHRARLPLDRRWVTLVERPMVGWRIVRTTPPPKTYGKAIPAFIHNGNYFLDTVDVYADGAIDCWGFVDLALFREKLVQGWVVPQARVGGTLSINNLGAVPVTAAEWDLESVDIESQVTDALRDLNPTLEGLLDMQGSNTEVRYGRRFGKMGHSDEKVYRVSLAGEEIAGAELPVLEITADGYRLRRWIIYADGQSQLDYASQLIPLESVARMFEEGRLTLSVPAECWVTLDGLGRFQAGEGWWGVKPPERIREASGLLEELNGGPGAIRTCVEAHRAYEADPSPEHREALRRAYEAVPEHRRLFCGDMDSKDWPIRRILYGERGW